MESWLVKWIVVHPYTVESKAAVNLLSQKDSYNILNRVVTLKKCTNNYFFAWNSSVREWEEPQLFELSICQDFRIHFLYLDIKQLGVLKYLCYILTLLQFLVMWSLYDLFIHSVCWVPFWWFPILLFIVLYLFVY